MAGGVKRRLGPVIKRAMERFSVPGTAVGVLHEGEEHHLAYGVTSVEFPLEIDEDTLFQIGSTTKTYTGTALMMLVDEGRVDLDAPVTEYLPKFKLPDAAAVAELRVRHLVTHTGGFLGDYFDDLGRGGDALARTVARMRRKTPQLTAVGRLWSYNNAGFYVLGRIIEAVTRQAYEDVVNERILRPLGMANTFWFAEDVITRKAALGHNLRLDGSLAIARPWGIPRGANPAGGIVSTSVDQLKYARFHLNGGRADSGTRLLKAATVRRMQKPLAPVGWALADHMGVTWMLDRFGPVTVAKHGGSINGHMSEFLLVPAKGVALSVLTNGQRGHELGSVVVKWVLEELAGIRVAAPAVKSISARAARAYTGRYPIAYGDFVVTAENGGLLLRLDIKKELLKADPEIAAMLPPPRPVAFVAKDRAVVQGDYTAGAKVDFFRDDNGDVEWMRTGGRIYKRATD